MERNPKKSETAIQAQEQPETLDVVQELENEKNTLNEQILSLEQEKEAINKQKEQDIQSDLLNQESQKQIDIQKIEIEELKRKLVSLQREKEEAQKIYIGGTATSNKVMQLPEAKDVLDVMQQHFLNPANRRN